MTTFQMTSHMLSRKVRETKANGIHTVICETGYMSEPYAKFTFDRGVWTFVETLKALPAKVA